MEKGFLGAGNICFLFLKVQEERIIALKSYACCASSNLNHHLDKLKSSSGTDVLVHTMPQKYSLSFMLHLPLFSLQNLHRRKNTSCILLSYCQW